MTAIRLTTMTVLMLAGLAATSAQAADAGPYDYLAARYTLLGDYSRGNSDGDVTGLGLEGSKSINDTAFLHITSDMYDVDIDGSSSDAAIDLFSVGPGVHVPLNTGSTPVDLWGAVNYQRLGVLGAASSGLGLDIGVRARFSNRLEGSFTFTTASTESGNRDIDLDRWVLGVAWAASPQFDVTGSLVNADFGIQNAQDIELDNLIRVGVRFPF